MEKEEVSGSLATGPCPHDEYTDAGAHADNADDSPFVRMVPWYCGWLLVIVSINGYAVPDGKGEKVVPVYPVLPSGESESRQVPLFNPAQDGHFTDAAMSGHDTGGEVFRVGASQACVQVVPPLKPTCRAGKKPSAFFTAYVVHAVNHLDENTGNTLTPPGYI